MIISIPNSKRKEITRYCEINISPRKYYLHSATGGVGWNIYYSATHDEWHCKLDDDRHATMIRLKYA